MPSLALVLKQEIHRLAKKAQRSELESLRKGLLAQKRQVSTLKKELAALQAQVARMGPQARAAAPVTGEAEAGQKRRFVAKGFRSLRIRLGLTLDEMAKLLGVSPQSVYNWEHARARPRAAQIQLIAELRALGKRQVRARLAETA